MHIRLTLLGLATLYFSALAAAKNLPVLDSALVPTRPVMIIGSTETVDPEIARLRVEQNAALARGERAEVRRVEFEIQRLMVSRQPQPWCPVPPPTLLPPGPSRLGGDGPDIAIAAGQVMATATDYESDGTMWVVFALADSSNYIYRSNDHGITWQSLASFNWYYAVRRLGLVVEDGDSSFIHVFVIHPGDNGDLCDVRFTRDGLNMEVLPVATGPDTVSDFAVAREHNPSQYFLYAVVNNDERLAPPGANSALLRSSDFGRNWAVCETMTNISQPHLSVGSDAYVYFACVVTPALYPGLIGVSVSDLYGSPGSWLANTVILDTFQVADPVIGAAFTQPESSAVIWCMYSHNYLNTGDWDIIYSHSTNGGWTWPTISALAFSNDAEQWADLKHFVSPGNSWMNASYLRTDAGNYRTIYRRYANSAGPTDWSDTLRINSNSAATGREVRPLLDYTPGGPFSGAGCVFVGAGLNGCWWNAPYPTGSAEPHVPIVAATRLSVLPSIGHGPFLVCCQEPTANLTVHDRAGRLVRTLALDPVGVATWDGTDDRGRELANGVYFCRLNAGGYTGTEKLVLQR